MISLIRSLANTCGTHCARWRRRREGDREACLTGLTSPTASRGLRVLGSLMSTSRVNVAVHRRRPRSRRGADITFLTPFFSRSVRQMKIVCEQRGAHGLSILPANGEEEMRGRLESSHFPRGVRGHAATSCAARRVTSHDNGDVIPHNGNCNNEAPMKISTTLSRELRLSRSATVDGSSCIVSFSTSFTFVPFPFVARLRSPFKLFLFFSRRTSRSALQIWQIPEKRWSKKSASAALAHSLLLGNAFYSRISAE